MAGSSSARIDQIYCSFTLPHVPSYGHLFMSMHQRGGVGARKSRWRCSGGRQRGTSALTRSTSVSIQSSQTFGKQRALRSILAFNEALHPPSAQVAQQSYPAHHPGRTVFTQPGSRAAVLSYGRHGRTTPTTGPGDALALYGPSDGVLSMASGVR
jgi:hypothetical protein